jgi:hypothetical protein
MQAVIIFYLLTGIKGCGRSRPWTRHFVLLLAVKYDANNECFCALAKFEGHRKTIGKGLLQHSDNSVSMSRFDQPIPYRNAFNDHIQVNVVLL